MTPLRIRSPDTVAEAERWLKEVIRDYAPTVQAGTMLWSAAYTFARAMQRAERERGLKKTELDHPVTEDAGD